MSKAKRKGTRIEREIVDLHTRAGIDCKRVPWSGAIAGLHPEYDMLRGDVRVFPDSPDCLVGEVKARANGLGFKTIENWLGDNDILFIKRDRQKPLVVLTMTVYMKLLRNVTLSR